jgi:hypothetical protein
VRRRDRDDAGSALIELSWLAIILLVPLIWIVISVFEVQRGAFATSAAARAAGRAYALAPDDATGAARARAVVHQVLADQGSPDQRAEVVVTCESPAPSCHVGTAVITVRVHSGVELPFFPQILGRGAAVFSLDASHTVPIGQYVESVEEGP